MQESTTFDRKVIDSFVTALVLCFLHGIDGVDGAQPPRPPSPVCELRLPLGHLKFDPASDLDLKRLARMVDEVLEKSAGAREGATLNRIPLQKRHRRGLEQLQRQIRIVGSASAAAQRNESVASLLEILAALNNDQQARIPPTIDVLETPWLFFRQTHRPVGHGRAPANNLTPGPQSDLSRLDPVTSTIWHRPARISAADVYHGFGRTNRLQLEPVVCVYSEPKASFGLNPGFEVDANGVSIKVKFAEVSSEAFLTRIFDALGFHVEPTDYAPAVKVRYDRRMVQEFDSRRSLHTRFTLFGFVPLHTLELQKRHDPFAYIAWAVCRDGTRWSGQELKARLFHKPQRPHPEDDAAAFIPAVESEIDYLITVPANVQARDPRVKSVGLWHFGQLDHAGRRELRGIGLLAAWLGWFDTRSDNTLLCVVKHQDRTELVHYLSDLGGGLGQTSGLLFCRGELPNAFPWAFTCPPLWQGPHRLAIPLRLAGYKPIVPTKAFAEMTIDDARWMARLISQLTELQLIQALVASGYDSAAVQLYTEKLVSRRDRMILDLGLAQEIPPLRPAGIMRKFSYEPLVHGRVSVALPGSDGLEVQAPVGQDKIVQGMLVKRLVRDAGSNDPRLTAADPNMKDRKPVTTRNRRVN